MKTKARSRVKLAGDGGGNGSGEDADTVYLGPRGGDRRDQSARHARDVACGCPRCVRQGMRDQDAKAPSSQQRPSKSHGHRYHHTDAEPHAFVVAAHASGVEDARVHGDAGPRRERRPHSRPALDRPASGHRERGPGPRSRRDNAGREDHAHEMTQRHPPRRWRDPCLGGDPDRRDGCPELRSRESLHRRRDPKNVPHGRNESRDAGPREDKEEKHRDMGRSDSRLVPSRTRTDVMDGADKGSVDRSESTRTHRARRSGGSSHDGPRQQPTRTASRIVWSLTRVAPDEDGGGHSVNGVFGRTADGKDGDDDDDGATTDGILPREVAYIRRVYNRLAAEVPRTPPLGSPAPGTSDAAVATAAGRSLGSERMRAANNMLKSLLFSRYVPRHKDGLEFGCNRGQDVAKIDYTKPRRFIFVDVAERCLAEAERRWARAGAATFPAAFIHADFCSSSFLTGLTIACHLRSPSSSPSARSGSCPSPRATSTTIRGAKEEAAASPASSPGTRGGGPPAAWPHPPEVAPIETGREAREIVDTVSCQFAAHHAFYSTASAERFVANVCRVLRPGGVFLGTAPSGEAIYRLLAAMPPGSCYRRGPLSLWREGSDGTAAATDDDDGAGLPRGFGTSGMSGIPYRFRLDSRGDVDPGAMGRDADDPIVAGYREHTMSLVDLTVMCMQHGMRPILRAPMGAFYWEESINPKNEELMRRMGLLGAPPSDVDIANMDLYVAFVFVKVGHVYPRAPLSTGMEPAIAKTTVAVAATADATPTSASPSPPAPASCSGFLHGPQCLTDSAPREPIPARDIPDVPAPDDLVGDASCKKEEKKEGEEEDKERNDPTSSQRSSSHMMAGAAAADVPEIMPDDKDDNVDHDAGIVVADEQAEPPTDETSVSEELPVLIGSAPSQTLFKEEGSLVESRHFLSSLPSSSPSS